MPDSIKKELESELQEIMECEKEPLENHICPISLDGWSYCRGDCENCNEYDKFKQEYFKNK